MAALGGTALGTVVAVSRAPEHRFSKPNLPSIRLLDGLGVDGDAHCGVTVKHRSRVRVDPTQPNLRQVHLLHDELLDELNAAGFAVAPGAMGENVLTRGLDLLALPVGARLHLGATALVEITGLRNPCSQIEAVSAGTACRRGRARCPGPDHPQGRHHGDRAGRGRYRSR